MAQPLQRTVLVRYFLDRPGVTLSMASSVFWKNPPEKCSVQDIKRYLLEAGIIDDGITAQIRLEEFQCYMGLEALEGAMKTFDFKDTSLGKPGHLDVRLTTAGGDESAKPTASSCTMAPVGLFALSMTVGLEAAVTLSKLVDNSVEPAFAVPFAVYGFWVGGFLQLLVGIFEATRNNIYGATAFTAFGCFWLANGLQFILTTYLDVPEAPELREKTPWGTLIKDAYITLFILVLFYQTLRMNRVGQLIIGWIAVWLVMTICAGWSDGFTWAKIISAIFLSMVSFYGFTAELTNEIRHKEVMCMCPVQKETEEVFGAAGRGKALQPTLYHLRKLSRKVYREEV